jgi:translation initiation factor 3 subunit D
MGSITLAELAEAHLPVPPASTILECGKLERYSNSFDRIIPKTAVTLQSYKKRQRFTATTSADPVLQRLMKEKAGNVFATDTILACLMASPRSVNSWDLVVRKHNGQIIFDKRPNSKIDYISVNENWNEVQQTDRESINHPEKLSREATTVAHNFSQQVLILGDTHEYEEPNPFLPSLDKENFVAPSSVAYTYRSWLLGDGVKLVARCEINGFTKVKGKKQYLALRAVNQFDPKISSSVDWRQKLESQSGTVFATEMKNNSNVFTRWLAEANLAGVDEIRVGFISRIHPKKAGPHEVLMVKKWAPTSMANLARVNYGQLWGTLKAIIDVVQGLDDGQFLILRDPNNPTLHVHAIPDDAFDHESGDVFAEEDDSQ